MFHRSSCFVLRTQCSASHSATNPYSAHHKTADQRPDAQETQRWSMAQRTSSPICLPLRSRLMSGLLASSYSSRRFKMLGMGCKRNKRVSAPPAAHQHKEPKAARRTSSHPQGAYRDVHGGAFGMVGGLEHLHLGPRRIYPHRNPCSPRSGNHVSAAHMRTPKGKADGTSAEHELRCHACSPLSPPEPTAPAFYAGWTGSSPRIRRASDIGSRASQAVTSAPSWRKTQL